MTSIVKFEGWDLDATTGDEPRVRDLDVGVRGGLARPRDVRRIIEKNWNELTTYGEIRVCALSAQTSGGRPGHEYWLTEEQATALVTMLKTPTARALRVVLVKLFVAYRRGQLATKAIASAPMQARIGDDTRAAATIRALSRTASLASGMSIQRIQGAIRKPWGVMSIYRIALSSYDHTVARLVEIIESTPLRRLPVDRRQLDMWKSTFLHNGTAKSCGCMQARVFRSGAQLPGHDDELLASDTLADLEEAFGESHMPMPRGPVFHQSLSSDFELGVIT